MSSIFCCCACVLTKNHLRLHFLKNKQHIMSQQVFYLHSEFFAIIQTILKQILVQICSFLRRKTINADISKNVRGMRHKFQNKNFKDIMFLCFKAHIVMLYHLGDTTRQSPCGFAHNVATFADIST